MELTLNIPDELSAVLGAPGSDFSRTPVEAIALEAYREDKLSASQLRRLLGFQTRAQLHAFLKAHGVFLSYGWSDLEHDRHAGDAIEPQAFQRTT